MEHVKIQIYNKGFSNPVLSSQSFVDFNVLNSNNYLCEWRGCEKHGPCTLDQNITSKLLYGDSLPKIKEFPSLKNIPKDIVGAISIIKQVSNRVSYHKVTSKYVSNKFVDIAEAEIHLRPLMDIFVITSNANSHIGPKYINQIYFVDERIQSQCGIRLY